MLLRIRLRMFQYILREITLVKDFDLIHEKNMKQKIGFLLKKKYRKQKISAR